MFKSGSARLLVVAIVLWELLLLVPLVLCLQDMKKVAAGGAAQGLATYEELQQGRDNIILLMVVSPLAVWVVVVVLKWVIGGSRED